MAGADYGRIQDPQRFEHYVYRLLDKKGQTFYIGCTMNLKVRMGEHRRHGTHGPLLADYETQGPFNYQDARKLELFLILSEQPKCNSEWKPRGYWFRGKWVTARPMTLGGAA